MAKYSPEYAATKVEKVREAYRRDTLGQRREEDRYRYEAIGRAAAQAAARYESFRILLHTILDIHVVLPSERRALGLARRAKSRVGTRVVGQSDD